MTPSETVSTGSQTRTRAPTMVISMACSQAPRPSAIKAGPAECVCGMTWARLSANQEPTWTVRSLCTWPGAKRAKAGWFCFCSSLASMKPTSASSR